MPEHRDVLIIGQGLAGTSMAWRLLERERSFLVLDRNEPVTSSKVAAGLITPVTGMRLNLNWRYAETYAEALRFYRRCGRTVGERFIYPRRSVRLFRKPEEVALWKRRIAEDPSIRRFAGAGREANLVDQGVFEGPLGGFEQRHGGYVDTSGFIEASRRHFEQRGSWMAADVQPADVRDTADGIEWNGWTFDRVIWATGWEGSVHPLFAWVQFDSARGTVLNLNADLQGERRIVNRGCWVLPRADGTLRAGPTYELHFNPAQAHTSDPEKLKTLEGRLNALIRVPFEITGSQTAVRPIVARCKVGLMGAHPGHPRVIFFNGLGSKGALRAPWLSVHLTQHLLDGAALLPELDLQQNLP